MSGHDCCNKWVFNFRRNVVSDEADWTSAGRLFKSRGPAAAKERSPTVTRRDGRTSRRMEVNEFSWPRRLVLQPVRRVLRCSDVKSSVDNDRQFELGALRCSEPVKTSQSIYNML